MNFESCLEDGTAKLVMPNSSRASGLFISSKQAVETAIIIPVQQNTLKSILRELYEGLGEFCEGLGYQRGYKFQDHESTGYFIRDILGEPSVASVFDRYRRLRNGINYYGEDVDIETVKEAIIEIPMLVKKLEKYSVI